MKVFGLIPTKSKVYAHGMHPTLSKDITKASITPSQQAYMSSHHLIGEIQSTINEAQIPEE